MKRLIFIFLLLPAIVFADDNWSGQAKIYKTMPTDTERIVQTSTGLQVSLRHIKTGLYPFLSYDITPIRFGGQRGADIDLWGFGFGIEREVIDKLTLFCQVGWYQPQWEHNGEPLVFGSEHLTEGLWIYTNQKLVPPFGQINFPMYSLEYHGNIGGVVGANFAIPLSDNIDFNLSGAYRYLKLQEMIKGIFSIDNPDCWQYKQDRDFSGWQVGLGIEWRF